LEPVEIYRFLIRLGSNYGSYGFEWEPFRDVAGPLEPGPGALPIVVLSDDNNSVVPKTVRGSVPIEHYQLWLSPGLSAELVANAWLELLVDAGATLGDYHGPFDWFWTHLNLKHDQLSAKSRAFLLA
jgi:hypothetical protein